MITGDRGGMSTEGQGGVSSEGQGRMSTEGEAGAGTHLRFHARRQFDRDTAGNGGAMAGHQFDFAVDGGEQIQSGGARGGVMRQCQIAPIGEALQSNFHRAFS